MDLSFQQQQAEKLRALHHAPQILILANVWDAVSARIVEAAGASAIATSSAAVAFTLGYADGERVSRQEMLSVASRIVNAVSLPVTVDLEAGYSDSLPEIELLVHELIATGAVGLNLEDGSEDDSSLRPLELQLQKIRTIRETSNRAGVRLVINARTDAYLLQVGEPGSRFAETVRRGRAFREAGADCVFVPGIYDHDVIGALVKEIGGPINILAGPGAPPAPELEKLGVARLSTGSGTYRAALGLLREITHELLAGGTYGAIKRSALPSREVNGLFQSKQQSVSR